MAPSKLQKINNQTIKKVFFGRGDKDKTSNSPDPQRSCSTLKQNGGGNGILLPARGFTARETERKAIKIGPLPPFRTLHFLSRNKAQFYCFRNEIRAECALPRRSAGAFLRRPNSSFQPVALGWQFSKGHWWSSELR